MSVREGVEPLTGLCLQSIAQNMQSVWMSDYVSKKMDEYNFLYIEGPFNQLAGPLVQELIRILGESHKLNKGSLRLLLQPHLSELSLRPCAGLINHALVQLVTVRCKLLTSLDLHSCSRVPAPSLASLIGGLPRLTKLCLADTQCDSLVLEAIGRSCPRLVELDLSRCKKVSAASLLSLAYDVTTSTFCCQALRVLLLQDLNPKGGQWAEALCFVLLALPNLEQLSDPSLPAALGLLRDGSYGKLGLAGYPPLAEVAERARDLRRSPETSLVNQRPSLRLKKLEDLAEEDVSLLGPLCPLLEEVAISLGGPPSASWSLVQWPRLRHLTLHCAERPERTLEELLASLEVVGRGLQLLSVQNLLWCHDESLTSLLTSCPDLRSFHGHFTVRRQDLPRDGPDLPPWAGDPLPLPRLHTFHLLTEGDGLSQGLFRHKLGGSLVSLLKGSPGLEALSLVGNPAPLDSVFEAVYGSAGAPQPLRRLRAVSLCSSDVTPWGASLIIRSKSPLRTLDLSHCREVTCRDHRQLQERARNERLNLTITWL